MTTAAKVNRAHVQDILTKKWSTRQYNIEYRGFLSNHILHGIVALMELGASDEQLNEFATYYAKKLESRAITSASFTSDDDSALSIESARQLIGKRQHFDKLLALYKEEIQKYGVDGAMSKHLPALVGGLAGALLHGLIQLGYAYHIGGDQLVAEGLAYMHYSFLSFEEPNQTIYSHLVKGKTFSRQEALQLFRSLGNNEFLVSEMHKHMQSEAVAKLNNGLYQQKLNALSGHPDRGSQPAFRFIWETINQYDLSEINGTFALDIVCWLYVSIDHNDFVIAHAVTSAWSLKQMEHLLDRNDRIHAWRVWLHVALAAYITREVGDLSESDPCLNCEWKLERLESWDQIVAQALALPGHPDEHVYKVVQVAFDHSTAAGNESRFLSPEERNYITRKSAIKVLTVEFDHAKLLRAQAAACKQ